MWSHRHTASTAPVAPPGLPANSSFAGGPGVQLEDHDERAKGWRCAWLRQVVVGAWESRTSRNPVIVACTQRFLAVSKSIPSAVGVGTSKPCGHRGRSPARGMSPAQGTDSVGHRRSGVRHFATATAAPSRHARGTCLRVPFHREEGPTMLPSSGCRRRGKRRICPRAPAGRAYLFRRC